MPIEAIPFETMEAKLVDALPTGGGWQFEPKWDGFRCLAVKRGGEAVLFAKSGKPLHRFFPEVQEFVRALPADDFVLDGELLIPFNGTLSFEALQMRLHPAESRIRKLAKEIPARIVCFDLPVAPGGKDMREAPLTERRAALEELGEKLSLRLSPMTRNRDVAEGWLESSGSTLDGVVCKKLDGPYVSGERAMLKVKRRRTADCVVGGFRYGTNSPYAGSLLLGLYNSEGKLDHVGFTSSFARADLPALTEKLKPYAGGPGFTGNSPGGPSRWSTERTEEYVPLRHELVVEVSFDQMSGGRFRHGTALVRWRPDKAPTQCTYEQLAPPAKVDELVAPVLE